MVSSKRSDHSGRHRSRKALECVWEREAAGGGGSHCRHSISVAVTGGGRGGTGHRWRVFFSRHQRLATLLVAWLATNFLVYRLGLWWMGWHKPCGCMGSLTSALHLSEQAADNIMKGVLAYLLLGSYGLLVWQWRQRRGGQARLDNGGLKMESTER